MENYIENQQSACCKTPCLHGSQCIACGADRSGSYNEAILQIPAFIRKRISLEAHTQEMRTSLSQAFIEKFHNAMEQQREEASLDII